MLFIVEDRVHRRSEARGVSQVVARVRIPIEARKVATADFES